MRTEQNRVVTFGPKDVKTIEKNVEYFQEFCKNQGVSNIKLGQRSEMASVFGVDSDELVAGVIEKANNLNVDYVKDCIKKGITPNKYVMANSYFKFATTDEMKKTVAQFVCQVICPDFFILETGYSRTLGRAVNDLTKELL